VISPEDYKVLQQADIILNGKVAEVLNKNGQPSWTVCPNCCIDDFTHVEDCPLIDKEI
jgi:hypothetical protein